MKVGMMGCVALLIFLGFRTYVNRAFETTVTSATRGTTGCLVMKGSTTNEQDSRTYIVGSIQNTCERKISQATVVFKLAKRAGPMENMSEAIVYAYVRDLDHGETKKFKSAFPVPKDAIFHFDRINGF